MGKLGNTLMLLNILSTGVKYTIKDLSELLEVSPRMIRYYVTNLEEAGIYIDKIRGNKGGYAFKGDLEYKFYFNIFDLRFLEQLSSSLKNNNFPHDNKMLESIINKIRSIHIFDNNITSTTCDENIKFRLLKYEEENRTVRMRVDHNKIVNFNPIFHNIHKQCYFFTGKINNSEELRTYNLSEIKEIF